MELAKKYCVKKGFRTLKSGNSILHRAFNVLKSAHIIRKTPLTPTDNKHNVITAEAWWKDYIWILNYYIQMIKYPSIDCTEKPI